MEPVPKNMLYGNNNGANAVKVMAGLVRASEFGTGTWAVGRTLDQDMLTSRARSEIILTTSTLTSNQSSTVLKVNEVNTCKGIVKFIKYFQTLLQAAHMVISAAFSQREGKGSNVRYCELNLCVIKSSDPLISVSNSLIFVWFGSELVCTLRRQCGAAAKKLYKAHKRMLCWT